MNFVIETELMLQT